MKKLLTVSFFFILTISVAQKQNNEQCISIHKAIDKINVNGVLDEKSWDLTETACDFKQIFPFDT